MLFVTLQELNVRQLTLSTDKDKYGIRLRAEPDHMVLGKRLKGAFKSITASIKELTSEQLESFQKKGMGRGYTDNTLEHGVHIGDNWVELNTNNNKTWSKTQIKFGGGRGSE